jgi:serine/threonine-protein kinase
MMTPAYAAPEQLHGGRVGIHTDVYALGVVLYELIAGRLPFDPSGLTSAELATAILEDTPHRPSVASSKSGATADDAQVRTASASQWADLDVLCLTALHKDPQRRYATVDALIRDVDHYLKGEPLEARRDSVRYRVGKFVRRNWEFVAAAAAVFVIVVGMAVFYTMRLTNARNAALAEAARAQRIQRFTLNLFEGGDKAAGPADSLRVVTLLERGLGEARRLDAEPKVQAELYLTLGGIYQQLGNLSRADSLMHVALERRRLLLGPNDADVAGALVALGSLRIDQAQFEDAERLTREAVGIATRALPSNHPDVMKALATLGRVLQERGAYDKAIPVLEDVVRRTEAAKAPPADLAANLSALADVHFYAGHYDVSDSLNRRVLAMYRQAYGDRHPLVADILVNLGATQQERGNYTDAENFDRQALAITKAF